MKEMLTISAQPLVSVLTPSYHQAAWLPDNLRSVECQSYRDIEHIVMDGGSTDGTVEILREAGGRLRWKSAQDRGQSHALNKAFEESRGEIVGWLNSDDAYFDCGVIEDVVAYFSSHPEVDVAYGHALQTTSNGAAIQVLWAPDFDHELLKAVDFIPQPAAFMRRSALSEPMVDESYHFGMDYELWIRLAEGSRRFGRIGRLLAIDRHQPARKSSVAKDVYRDNLVRLASAHEMHLAPEWERERTAFYVRQRLLGALLIPRIRGPFAFSTPPGMKRGLLRRQLFQRRSQWPEEYR